MIQLYHLLFPLKKFLYGGYYILRWPSFQLLGWPTFRLAYTEEMIFSKSLLSLTKLEKELGKKEFEEILGSLIDVPPGKIQLVPEADKRPEIQSSAEIDFKN